MPISLILKAALAEQDSSEMGSARDLILSEDFLSKEDKERKWMGASNVKENFASIISPISGSRRDETKFFNINHELHEEDALDDDEITEEKEFSEFSPKKT